jgi:hypothetical protein
MNAEEEFYLEVAQALSSCQLVEQILKRYISEAFDLARKCIGDKMVFSLSGDDYEDSSLERLIGTFRKLTNNRDLVKDLEKFKAERNYLSHKGIANCLDPMGHLSEPETVELRKRLEHIEKESHRLRLLLHDEAGKFRPHLWFWDVTND